MPAASDTTVWRLPQPTELPRTSAQTIPYAPPVTSVRPGTSSAVSGPKLSGDSLHGGAPHERAKHDAKTCDRAEDPECSCPPRWVIDSGASGYSWPAWGCS